MMMRSAVLTAFVLGVGCSSTATEMSKDAASPGSAGSSGGGATVSTGGDKGSGGAIATGGDSGSGGTLGSGGNGGESNGGGSGSGGSAGSAGSAGMTGGASSGGRGNAAGATGGRGGGDAGGSAGGVAGGGGTAGASTAYSPCPAPPAPCKILPFGDSITMGVGSNGSNSNGGYRVELFHRAHADGKSITFVGTAAANGPTTVDGVPFPREHEGHSGYTIDNAPGRSGISPLVARVMPATTPDIVTLMIGTNDVQHDIDVTNAPARLGKLLDSIIATDAHMLLVVAQIVPTTDATVNVAVQAFNNAVPALINSRIAAGKHIVLVDMYHPIASAPGFQTSGATVPDNTVGPMFDWLHPNVAGYKVMGDTWYEAIKSALR